LAAQYNLRTNYELTRMFYLTSVSTVVVLNHNYTCT